MAAAETSMAHGKVLRLSRFGNLKLGHFAPGAFQRGERFRALRLDELRALIRHRHGGPPRGAGEVVIAYAVFGAHHIASPSAIAFFFEEWTPGLPAESRSQILRAATSSPRRWNADNAGAWLGVRIEERDALRLKTIGTIDATKRQRKLMAMERRRERDRERARRLRAAKAPIVAVQDNAPTKRAAEAAGITRRALQKRLEKSRDFELVRTYVAHYRRGIWGDTGTNYFRPAPLQPRLINLRISPKSPPLVIDMNRIQEPLSKRLAAATAAYIDARMEYLALLCEHQRLQEAALDGPRRRPGRKPRTSTAAS